MCQIVYKTKEAKLNFEYLDKAQKHNKDGYGVAWYEDDVVKTYKTFNYKQFKRMLGALRDKEYIAHLRNKTKGSINYNQIHPFEIPSGVMFHNGTILSLSKLTNVNKSDSQVLAGMLNNTEYNYIEDIQPFLEQMIDDKINRLAFLELDGRVTILNEHLGMWEDGVWYSNDYHKKPDSWSRTSCACNPDVGDVIDIDIDIEDKVKVFVYGTLKRGYGNNHLLEKSVYLGKAHTTDKWVMINNHSGTFPYLLFEDDTGEYVEGEVYLVDTHTKDKLDMLEGVPFHYVEEKINVTYEDGTTDDVLVYTKARVDNSDFTKPRLKNWTREV